MLPLLQSSPASSYEVQLQLYCRCRWHWGVLLLSLLPHTGVAVIGVGVVAALTAARDCCFGRLGLTSLAAAPVTAIVEVRTKNCLTHIIK